MSNPENGEVDLEKPGRYPIVLSDALMGRGTKEVFTSVRYNHKPEPSSDSELGSHQLKPSNNNLAEYELSFSDGSGKYEYQGVRHSGDGQYVLIFDPIEKHFVLHQLDSSFDMNMASAPWDQNADNLRATYDQLQLSPRRPPKKSPPQQKSKALKESKPVARPEPKRRKVEKPKKQKPKPPPKEPTPDAEDDESDDGLTIEYPGGPPPSRFTAHSKPLVPPKREDASEQSDADAEFEEDDDMERNKDVDALKLPSPVANPVATGGDLDIEEDEEVDLDLAAELEQALEKDESSESEEE